MPCCTNEINQAQNYVSEAFKLGGIVNNNALLLSSITTSNNVQNFSDKFVNASSIVDNMPTVSTTRVGSMLQVWDGGNFDRVRGGITAPINSALGFLNNLPYARYNATPLVLNDLQFASLQINSQGDLYTTERTITRNTNIVKTSLTGSTSANAISVVFTVISGTAIISGETFYAGETLTISAPNNDVLSSINYDATGGELRIITLT